MSGRLLKTGKRWLILGHRWLGIATCLFFALWIGSGLVMLYVPFPKLTAEERLALLPPLARDAITVSPDAALAASGLGQAPGSFVLEMRGREPVYRFAGPDGVRIAVSARDGRPMGPVDVADALAIAGGVTEDARAVSHPPPHPEVAQRSEGLEGGFRKPPRSPEGSFEAAGAAPQDEEEGGTLERRERQGSATGPGTRGGQAKVAPVERDQWTVTARYDALRPFHKVALDDAAGTELYVSARTGEIALDTTRWERGWNWVGAVVHWIYPTPLRARAELWRQVLLWTSGIAVFGALSGLVLGIWRLRPSRRYPSGAVTPYRGVARWHHLFGLAGGLTLTTFIVSGWLSMNPNRWFNLPSPPPDLLAAYAGPAGPIGLDAAALRGLSAPQALEMRFTRVAGRWLVTPASRSERRISGADGGAPSDEAALVAAARASLVGGVPPTVERLTAYDVYWYPHHDTRPLPVLRLRFADPASTWLHVDPRDGAILSRLDASGRAYRWLFSALHCLDLPVLIFHRPAWDALQWGLNALAAVIALTGVVIGWRRLGRSGGQAAEARLTRER